MTTRSPGCVIVRSTAVIAPTTSELGEAAAGSTRLSAKAAKASAKPIPCGKA